MVLDVKQAVLGASRFGLIIKKCIFIFPAAALRSLTSSSCRSRFGLNGLKLAETFSVSDSTETKV